jgi:recombination protein RecT
MTKTEIIESKAAHPMMQLRDYLDRRVSEIKTALPAHISPERFIRVVITAAQLNPEILACDRPSLWNACMRAANDGLLPDGVEGAIVPFKSKATWIPMYQGLLKQFRNSGEFKWVSAGLVYEGDDYDHWIDETGEHFHHRPADDNTGKKIRRVYALATTKEGGSFIADLSIADINKRRAMSRATREDAPWKMWEAEMMKKTALRVLSKLLPKSSDIDALMRRDEEALYGVEAVEERRHAVARPADTISTLDAFGADDPETPVGERQGSETPEGGGTVASESRAETAARDADSGPANFSDDPEVEAFERGKEARSRGTAKRAIPGEYRDISKLAIAWIRGWEAGSK